MKTWNASDRNRLSQSLSRARQLSAGRHTSPLQEEARGPLPGQALQWAQSHVTSRQGPADAEDTLRTVLAPESLQAGLGLRCLRGPYKNASLLALCLHSHLEPWGDHQPWTCTHCAASMVSVELPSEPEAGGDLLATRTFLVV